MRHALILLLSLALAGPALAEDTLLERLETGEDARGWEAVGRLDIDGKGFCTASLIGDDLVLTAAHCLYDSATGERVGPERLRFNAGLRNGMAVAYRRVRRAVVHPDYHHSGRAETSTVPVDLALLQLDRPIRVTGIEPFPTAPRGAHGDEVGVVSYAMDRAEAPSLQELCSVLGRQDGVLVLSCSVDYGSSGAPVFLLDGGRPRILSVVSAKAEIEDRQVSLGMELDRPLEVLRAELAAGRGDTAGVPPNSVRMLGAGQQNGGTGAKFVRP